MIQRLSFLLCLLLMTACAEQSFEFENLKNVFQIGPEWGRYKVTPELIESNGEIFKNAARSTGKLTYPGSIYGPVAFYLGRYAGHHLMATNHHVTNSFKTCFDGSIRCKITFPFQNQEIAEAIKLIGTWPELDFSLFEIKITNQTLETSLGESKMPLSFNANIAHGAKILTMGFGFRRNDKRELRYNSDQDCRVYSGTNEFRFEAMNGKDESSRIWSFVHGCDSSSGDSGSAIINATSGEVIGILTAGAFPKHQNIFERKYMDNLFKYPDNRVWQTLSFATPSIKIHELISTWLENQKKRNVVDPDHSIIEAFLN